MLLRLGPQYLLPTSGGDLLCLATGFGFDASLLRVLWDGELVEQAEFVKTNAGLRLRVVIGPGCGGGSSFVSHISLRLHFPPRSAKGAKRRTRREGVRALRQPLFTLHTFPPLPSTTTTPANHALLVANGAVHSKILVTYTAPSILRVGILPTEGGEVTILGENFGRSSDAASGALIVSFDGEPATDVLVSQDHKKIKCTAKAGAGACVVRIELAGVAGEVDVTRSPPEVLELNPPDLDVTGGWVVLRGAHFGADAALVSVILPDVHAQALEVEMVKPHTLLRVLLPPLPPQAVAGAPLHLRVIVAGVPAAHAVDLVYSPPGGVPASSVRPAYITRRLVAPHDGVGPSPLKELFSTQLHFERKACPDSAKRKNSERSPKSKTGSPAEGGASTSPSAFSSASAPATASSESNNAAVPVVIGALAGAGPSVAITPLKLWQPDTPMCALCDANFSLLSKRRHHCRVCGSCVCGPCSPHEIRLTSSEPPVRVCGRCHLRVGLLTKMTKVLDEIEALKKLLGCDSDLFAFFKSEVVAAVTALPLKRLVKENKALAVAEANRSASKKATK